MYPAEFHYLSPRSAGEVISLLERHGDDAKVLAGGQSLVPMMNLRLAQPEFVIDINGLPKGEVRTDNGSLIVPAGARHRQLAEDPDVGRHAPLVQEAAGYIGNVRVRNRGTLGGSVAHADPSAELPCVLTALDAEVVATGSAGTRRIPARDFFVTHYTTALEPAELVTEVRIPRQDARTGSAFVEFTRRASDFAVVEVAAVVTLDRRGRCRRAALALGGVADRPVSAGDAVTEVLEGERPAPAAFAEAAGRVRGLTEPSDGVHGSAAFRLQLIETLTRRALATAADRARGGS
jgi:CO/xanthine dehydrogenase FAD-binding subunit